MQLNFYKWIEGILNNIFLKAWKDPVWSKVISVGLIGILGSLGSWLFGFWSQIKSLLMFILSCLTYEVDIPVWLLLVSIPLLLGLIPTLKSFKVDHEPGFLKYKKDIILGIDWNWGWSSPNFHNDKYSIRDLHPRCPNCKSSLELNDYSGQLVHCINDSCNWQWRPQGSFHNRISHSSELKQKVWNVIDRKIHNGEFKT